ncbi:MAG: TIGR03086 family metal-binding protein [Propionibacteriaceae bacterium]
MTTTLNLRPAAERVAALLPGVDDRRLDDATPCEKYAVADLLDHLMGLTEEFTRAAAKNNAPDPDQPASAPPQPSADHLSPAWRDELPVQLREVAEAWSDPAAWEGETTAGGVTWPAAAMGAVALNELVIHGWDLARATGQPYECDGETAQACYQFVASFPTPDGDPDPDAIFGPPVDVSDDAPPLDRALGLSGRAPWWSPVNA